MFIALLQDLCKKQYKKIYYIGTYTYIKMEYWKNVQITWKKAGKGQRGIKNEGVNRKWNIDVKSKYHM